MLCIVSDRQKCARCSVEYTAYTSDSFTVLSIQMCLDWSIDWLKSLCQGECSLLLLLQTQKVTENALPTQTPFPSSHISQKFPCGVVSPISFLVLSSIKIGWKMWEQWGVEILAFPLTWHMAYTTACCYRTSRDLDCQWPYVASDSALCNVVLYRTRAVRRMTCPTTGR